MNEDDNETIRLQQSFTVNFIVFNCLIFYYTKIKNYNVL